MDYGTTCYTQETPTWLWDLFTNGPADEYDRYSERITSLIAAEILVECPDQLTEEQRQAAETLAAEVDIITPRVAADVVADPSDDLTVEQRQLLEAVAPEVDVDV